MGALFPRLTPPPHQRTVLGSWNSLLPLCALMSQAPPWRLPMREALQKMTDKTLDGDTFLRSVMHHPRWLVSGQIIDGQPALGVMSTAKGRILEVYSDAQALESMERVHGDEFTGSILELEGHVVFEGLAAAQIDRVNLNPGSEPKLSYQHGQIDLLSAWAKQAKVELALVEPERVHDPLGVLAHYDNFHLVYQSVGESPSIVLAPDPEGRALGAIFSSWDTADAFCQVMKDEAQASLEAVRVPANEVFPLMKRMSVQGLVFNPWSLLPVRALRADILDELLKRQHH